jgi:hypothetical protein
MRMEKWRDWRGTAKYLRFRKGGYSELEGSLENDWDSPNSEEIDGANRICQAW